MEQGATYIDLTNLDLGEFTATGDMQVSPSNRIVAKKTVPYPPGNRLMGMGTPPRVGG